MVGDVIFDVHIYGVGETEATFYPTAVFVMLPTSVLYPDLLCRPVMTHGRQTPACHLQAQASLSCATKADTSYSHQSPSLHKFWNHFSL